MRIELQLPSSTECRDFHFDPGANKVSFVPIFHGQTFRLGLAQTIGEAGAVVTHELVVSGNSGRVNARTMGVQPQPFDTKVAFSEETDVTVRSFEDEGRDG